MSSCNPPVIVAFERRFRKIAREALGADAGYFGSEKPKFRFTRQAGES